MLISTFSFLLPCPSRAYDISLLRLPGLVIADTQNFIGGPVTVERFTSIFSNEPPLQYKTISAKNYLSIITTASPCYLKLVANFGFYFKVIYLSSDIDL